MNTPGRLCPRCGEPGHVIGLPNHLYDSGVPMRCYGHGYGHGEVSWLAFDEESRSRAAALADESKENAARWRRELERLKGKP